MSNSNFKYTSIDRIMSKIVRDYGLEDLDTIDCIEWIGEALEAIGAYKLYEEAVAFIEVKNYQANIPNGLHAIIQIAKNDCYNSYNQSSTAVCPNTATKLSTTVNDGSAKPDIPVALDCNGTPINAYELAYYRPYFDLKWEFGYFRQSSLYKGCLSPVRLASSNFQNSLVCTDLEQQHYGEESYNIIAGEILRFSFKEGQIALSYLRQKLDEETGYPLIPDTYSYTTAISSYILMKVKTKDMYKNREGASSLAEKATADWQWYCRQAKNESIMPSTVDEYENLLQQRNYLIPRDNSYYNFFGNLNKKEGRKFNDPDNRNNRGFIYFRGSLNI